VAGGLGVLCEKVSVLRVQNGMGCDRGELKIWLMRGKTGDRLQQVFRTAEIWAVNVEIRSQVG